MNYQRLFLDNLDLIAQIVRVTGRRRHLSAVEQEDFASAVNTHLIGDDYGVLRKFQARSSLATYLTVVITRFARDYFDAEWGRWRPSAMAERLGPAAVELERMVTRDEFTVEEAIEVVSSQNPGLPRSLLQEMWQKLPSRIPRASVSDEAATAVPARESSDSTVEDSAIRRDIGALDRALRLAFAQIDARDRVLIALRFDHGLPAAEIARHTGTSVPTVHRRLDHSIKRMRAVLTDAGVDPSEFGRLLGHSSLTLSPLLRAEVERFLGPVRLFKRDG